MNVLTALCGVSRRYNNEYYAKVGGVSRMEMNLLEMGFLFVVDFRLNVTPATFLSYSTDIQRQMLLSEPPLTLISLTPPPQLDNTGMHSQSGEIFAVKRLHG
ncbi:hypothetical protein ACLOJK_033843 [Asimina triloba]